METYVVAVKRECRDKAPDNWREMIQQLDGVKVIGSGTTRAIRICGPGGTGDNLAAAVGEYCHIEPVILHDKS